MSGLPRWAALILAALVVFLVATLFHGRPHQVLDIIALILAVAGVLYLVVDLVGGRP